MELCLLPVLALMLALSVPSPPALSAEETAPAARADGPEDAGAQVRKDEVKSSTSKTGTSGASADTRESICLMIEAAARESGLPLEFFARVIWQESRFRPNAIGPVTRSGARAEGIAQFMPGTAAERRLLNPFDPVQALPKSAEFLRELRAQFGNLGLAAAAYNAGPQRVRDWLAGRGYMPAETRAYVLAITGSTVEEWASGSDAGRVMQPTSCRELMARLRQAPNPFVSALERRVTLAAVKPWGIQLSAGFSRDQALTTFSRLQKRFSSVLSGHDPSILATRLRSRGTRPFYQVRIGADTRAGADSLCGRIQQAGGACMVLRNARGKA